MQHVSKILFYLSNRKQQILLLGIGLFVLVCIDFLTVQKLQRETEYKQTLMAQQIRAQLQSTLEEHVTALIALNVVYQNFVDINHYDFQQYGQSITENLKGFRRLVYIDPAFHIRHVYPLNAENEKLFSVSLQKNPEYIQLLHQAYQSRKPVTSNLTSFIGHPGSVLAAIPIYRNDQEFLGYAAGEISMLKIWKPISREEFLKNYTIQLLDPQGNAVFPKIKFDKTAPLTTVVPFRIADAQWQIVLQPVAPMAGILTIQRVTLWSVGLLILFLLHLLIVGSKRYKTHMDEAQQQFETIFQASPDGILMLNDKLELQLTNPPVESWSGLSRAELNQKTFFDLFTCQCPNLDKCRELSFLLCTSEQLETKLPDILEAQITNQQDGITRTLRLNANKMQEKASRPNKSGFICTLGDISTVKELERVKETYVATLTHDLKTPLIAQEMVLDTILSGKHGHVTEEQKKLLSGASESVQDLLEMVNSTLLFYKIESSHLQLNKQLASLSDLMRDVTEALRPLADKRQLSFELEASVGLPETWVDAVQLKRVFHNLLSNALNYAKRGTPIRIAIQPEGVDRLSVIVTNTGKGIAPSELSKIFDKYYSLSRKFKQIGTGLGLYISRRIIELHGGKIWAESEPDQETRFYISLPRPEQI